MEDREVLVYLEHIETSAKRQEKYARLQCFFAALAALSCLAVFVLALCLLPMVSQAQTLLTDLQNVLGDVQSVTVQLASADWEGMVENLENVSAQIAAADLAGIAEDVGNLVQSSQAGIGDAMAKINAIDIEGLNQAIQDLSDVIEPMAKFVNRFK